jgi:transketolase
MNENDQDLTKTAVKVRRDILAMSYRANSAHTGGALSVTDILVALYFSVLRLDPAKPGAPDRDRLIFSKAHDAKALYSVLARRGFFPTVLLEGYEADNGKLPGHTIRNCVPGVEISAGSLGHGLSVAAGMAWALKNQQARTELKNLKHDHSAFELQNTKRHPRVFAVLSDGECDEGSTWEAALFAGHHKLDNLTVVIDYNKLQGYGFTKNILTLEPFADKWAAFGFSVREVDGHSFAELIPALSGVPFESQKPSVVIAHTIKGIGGPKALINNVASQYKPPTAEELNELTGITPTPVQIQEHQKNRRNIPEHE